MNRMRDYPQFPVCIPLIEVDCVRVTHPCATRVSRRKRTVRLACIRPAASVHPEPGSNSSSLIFSFISTLRFCLQFILASWLIHQFQLTLIFFCVPIASAAVSATSAKRVQRYDCFSNYQTFIELFSKFFYYLF